MKVIETALPGVKLIEPTIHHDARGYFMETYAKEHFLACGIHCDFVQDNHSWTKRQGTLRGLHFQNDPMAQAKLVQVVKGCARDVVVDIRRDSPTFGHWIKIDLSAAKKQMLFVPRGFAHGFLTLTPDVIFLYKVDNYYSYEHSRSIAYNDPALGITWGIDVPVMSAADRTAPLLAAVDCNYFYEETRL